MVNFQKQLNFLFKTLLLIFISTKLYAVEAEIGKWNFFKEENYCFIISLPTKEEGDYDPSNKIFINYEPSSHPLNDLIGREFSIFQGLYNIPEFIYDNQISQLKFPKLNEIINDDNLFGYIVKYNITRKLFYAPAPHPKKNLMKLYDLYEEDNFTIEKSRPLLIIKNGKVFKTV